MTDLLKWADAVAALATGSDRLLILSNQPNVLFDGAAWVDDVHRVVFDSRPHAIVARPDQHRLLRDAQLSRNEPGRFVHVHGVPVFRGEWVTLTIRRTEPCPC